MVTHNLLFKSSLPFLGKREMVVVMVIQSLLLKSSLPFLGKVKGSGHTETFSRKPSFSLGEGKGVDHHPYLPHHRSPHSEKFSSSSGKGKGKGW